VNKRKLLSLTAVAFLALLPVSCRSERGEITAITHVNLVPMTGEMIIEDQTVLVQGPQIVATGDSDVLRVPEGATVIDGNRAYLMPGLADMHMHTRQDWADRDSWPVNPLNLYLANGVTTIRDFAPQGSSLTYVLQWRDEIHAGTRNGPTIYASGKLLYASPLGDPEGMVRQNHDLGFDFIKLYSYLSQDDFHEAMRATRALGMYTSGHIPYAVGLEGVLAEGMDEIAHVEELLFEFIDITRNQDLSPEAWLSHVITTTLAQWDLASPSLLGHVQAEESDTLISIVDQLRSADVPVCTTMVIDDVIQMKLFDREAFLRRAENRYLPSAYLESARKGEEKHQVMFKDIEGLAVLKYEIDRWILRELRKGDVTLLLGTDAGTGGMGIVPGYSLHDELRILVDNGFSPYEAIATGTINAAAVVERMTGDGDFGSIEEGNRADLVMVRDNPLEDVGTIREPLGVMAAGRWYPQEILAEMVEPDHRSPVVRE
jgi:imidazolonepropionase-like amidohydrolase